MMVLVSVIATTIIHSMLKTTKVHSTARAKSARTRLVGLEPKKYVNGPLNGQENIALGIEVLHISEAMCTLLRGCRLQLGLHDNGYVDNG